jgi:putative two-component system response regulator
MMPGMSGFELCKQIKSLPRLCDIPLLFLTNMEDPSDEEYGLLLGADDFIRKSLSPSLVLARVRKHLEIAHATHLLKTHNEKLEHMVAERTLELQRQSELLVQSKREMIAAQDATIMALCALTEVRDNETGKHIRRTQHYVRVLAESLLDHPRFCDTLDEEQVQLLFKSAPLHDVGKVAIPDAILLKSGKLTPEEQEIMKRHTVHGRDALAQAGLGGAQNDFLRFAIEIAYSHHEHWDGSGYPQGLAGEVIPLSARLMALADAYDSLVSPRGYKDAVLHSRALEIMQEGRGSHFDPDLFDIFIQQEAKFHAITQQFSEQSNQAAVEGAR